MEGQSLEEIIKSSAVIVHVGRFAYLQGKDVEMKNHFLITQDKDEITVITEEKNVQHTTHIKAVKWFTLIEIQVSAPFVATGFLAVVTKAISDQNLNVLVVSTFSKDYILVKEETADIAINALCDAGFPIQMAK